MTIMKVFESYDFHDSILESAVFIEKENRVILEIDFCNWMQKDFITDMPETEIVQIIFEGVTFFRMDAERINSDSILAVEVGEENSVCFKMFNDMTEKYYTLFLTASSVQLKRCG